MVGICFSNGDYRDVTVLSIMKNQILKAINHIKDISKKNGKLYTIKVFTYKIILLQVMIIILLKIN